MPATTSKSHKRIQLSDQEIAQRKRYLGATLITCLALAMVFGAAHVVKLGSNRMQDMRAKASYDLKDEHLHIRAAGEDIARHQLHEEQKVALKTYQLNEIESLIPQEKWMELETQVTIAEGPFAMGTNAKRSDLQDQPEHTIKLKAYQIDKYPVTSIQYARFVTITKHRPPLDWEAGKIPDNKYLHPVTMVTWYDAKAYCEHKGKRLPTEAEWEKAARGPNGNRFPWGNKMDPNRVNTYYNVGSTTVVDRYETGKSYYGVFDMAGNVSEWTASDFAPYQGSAAPSNVFKVKKLEATTPADKAMKVAGLVEVEDKLYKVRRGGSWKSDPFSTSSYHRNYSMPHYASDFFGFRCAKDM